jgi:hypothetical protein
MSDNFNSCAALWPASGRAEAGRIRQPVPSLVLLRLRLQTRARVLRHLHPVQHLTRSTTPALGLGRRQAVVPKRMGCVQGSSAGMAVRMLPQRCSQPSSTGTSGTTPRSRPCQPRRRGVAGPVDFLVQPALAQFHVDVEGPLSHNKSVPRRPTSSDRKQPAHNSNERITVNRPTDTHNP